MKPKYTYSRKEAMRRYYVCLDIIQQIEKELDKTDVSDIENLKYLLADQRRYLSEMNEIIERYS